MSYKCHENYLVRVPYFSNTELKRFLNDVDESNSSNYYSFLENGNSAFDCAIALATNDFVSSLDSNKVDKSQRNSVNQKIYKYFVRMASRPTPYGYFSGVFLSRFQERGLAAKGYVSDSKKYEVQADYNWVCNVIEKFEKEYEIVSKLKIQVNPQCYKYGDRFKNPYYSYYGKLDSTTERVDDLNIRYSELIKLIQNSASKFIGFADLVDILHDKCKEVDIKIIEHTICDLLESEFLISNLRVPAYCIDPLDHILLILEGSNTQLYTELVVIRKMINNLKLESHESLQVTLISELKMFMNNLYPTKNPFMVNYGYEQSELKLLPNIQKKTEKFADAMKLLYAESANKNMFDKFIRKFRETFGDTVEVDVIDIIDKNGFDLFSTFDFKSYKESDHETRVNNFFLNKIHDCFVEGMDTINISKEDIEENFSVVDESRYPITFDLSIFLTGDINKPIMTIGPNVGASKSGKIIQRFESVLDLETYKD